MNSYLGSTHSRKEELSEKSTVCAQHCRRQWHMTVLVLYELAWNFSLQHYICYVMKWNAATVEASKQLISHRRARATSVPVARQRALFAEHRGERVGRLAQLGRHSALQVRHSKLGTLLQLRRRRLKPVRVLLELFHGRVQTCADRLLQRLRQSREVLQVLRLATRAHYAKHVLYEVCEHFPLLDLLVQIQM